LSATKFLPPYSPDLSPIELCWSKLKEILRSAKTRTSYALDQAITMAVNVITDENALNWFNHCGLFFELMRESYVLWRLCLQSAVNALRSILTSSGTTTMVKSNQKLKPL
jgi:hypothetical protein